MFHIQQPTEQWIDEVVNVINENQLKPEESKWHSFPLWILNL